MIARESPVTVYSTCPPSSAAGEGYLRQVAEVARWSERSGCAGILVYTDNSLVDPWLVAAAVVESTERLAPLVAVQPVYMHPYSVAKMVASMGFLYRRRLDLNMVAGGFKNDLAALHDTTPHDSRYRRLEEYTAIVQRLLAGGAPVTFEGDFYRVEKLSLTPSLAPELRPEVFVSGSSEAGLAAARALGATAVRYPQPAEVEEPLADPTLSLGIRVGIIARERAAAAWTEAFERFPEDRKGQLVHRLAMGVSDSVWHRQLSRLGRRAEREDRSPYWLVPFENYKTFCPYLVGAYDRVAAELGRYFAAGFRRIILDVPRASDDLVHAMRAIRAAADGASAHEQLAGGERPPAHR